jgi:subtilisin family serine protease
MADDKDLEARLDQLLNHPRVVEALRNASSGRSAKIGLIADTKKSFYANGKAVVEGFDPSFIVMGDWKDGKLIDRDTAMKMGSDNFSAATVVDLARIGNAVAFFKSMLQLGQLTIAPRFSPMLWRGVPYIRADCTALMAGKTHFTGEEVAVCVIDMGCDFAHRNFRDPSDLSKTRLKLLSVLGENGLPSSEFSSAQIESMIARTNPYERYDPQDPKHHVVAPGTDGTHGTAILDIAGGNGAGTGVAGVAPKADLFFIQVHVTTDGTRRYIDGTQILIALKYAKGKIGSQPAVFNVSLGTNEGPHDPYDHDTSADAWNIKINSLFYDVAGKCLVVSAGNNYQSGLHASGKAAQGAPATFDVLVPAGDMTSNPFWFWLETARPETISFRTMLVDYKGAPKNYKATWQHPGMLIDDLKRESGKLRPLSRFGTDNLYSIGASIDPPLQRGTPDVADRDRWEIWRFEISSGAALSITTRIDAWMERDDLDQARFVTPVMPAGQSANADVDPDGSLNGLAAGVDTSIAVGAIGAATYKPGESIYGPGLGHAVAFSSAGPTRPSGSGPRRLRPDVSAPGEGIAAAKSCADPVALNLGYDKAPTTVMSGTSMSAAFVTGLVALLFDKFDANPPKTEAIRAALASTARTEEEGGARRWDSQRGHGCVDAVALLK